MTSLAQGAAGIALVTALALLGVRQVRAATAILGLQGAAVALAALLQRQPLAAGLTVLSLGIAAPILLRRLLARGGADQGATAPIGGTPRAVIVGAVLTVLALSIGKDGLPMTVVLLGLLLAATRRHPIMHILALAVLQNGLILTAIGRDGPQATFAALPLIPLLAGSALWRYVERDEAIP